MPRSFNKVVFEGNIRGTSETFTNPEFDDLLGMARDLVLQTVVQTSGGTTPALTIKHYHSNDRENWALASTPVNQQDVSSPPWSDIDILTGGPFAAYSRLSLAMDASDSTAYVRLIICGRSNS